MFDALIGMGIFVVPIGLVILIVQLLLHKSTTAGRVTLGIGLTLAGLGLFLNGLTGAAGSSPAPSPAPAEERASEDATNDGVTKEQYDAVEEGMSLAEVAEIFGSEGELMAESEAGEFTGETRVWEGESRGSNAMVVFVDGEVQAKSQVGLS